MAFILIQSLFTCLRCEMSSHPLSYGQKKRERDEERGEAVCVKQWQFAIERETLKPDDSFKRPS